MQAICFYKGCACQAGFYDETGAKRMRERNPLVLTLMSFDPFDCLRKEGERVGRAQQIQLDLPEEEAAGRRDPRETDRLW
jgi:hypothetical protein